MRGSRLPAPGEVGVSPQSVAAVRVCVLLILTLGCCATLWSLLQGGLEHIALPFVSFGILGLPAFSRSYRLVSSWTFVLVAALIGLVLRALMIQLSWPSEARVESLFIRSRDELFFSTSHLAFLGMCCLLIAGYWSTSIARTRPRGDAPLSRPELVLNERRLLPLLIFVNVVGLVSFAAYVSLTGGLDLATFSSKRSTISGLEIDDSFRSYQSLITINRVALVGYFIVLDFMMSRAPKLRSVDRIILFAMLVNGLLLAVYRSERLPIVVAILLTAMSGVVYGRSVRLKQILVTTVLVLGLFQVLTAARPGAVNPSRGAVLSSLESVVQNRNMIDPSKTAHIIDAVPETLQWANGETITTYVFAPIPRSLWPEKPLIAPGPEVGVNVYGTTRTGVPPGLFAELYWNFGTVGLLVGLPAIGYLFGLIERRLQVSLLRSGRGRVIAFIVLSQFATNVMGVSIGQAALRSSLDLILVLALFAIFGRRSSADIQRPTSSNSRAIPLAT